MGMSGPPGGKSPTALRTIGEVVAETGVAAHVLRYWERQVPALQPVRRAGDRRYYRPSDVALISEIAHLVNQEGYTLDGAARAASGQRRRAEATAGSLSADRDGGAALAAGDGVERGLGVQASGRAPASEGAISLPRLRGLRDRLQTALDSYG